MQFGLLPHHPFFKRKKINLKSKQPPNENFPLETSVNQKFFSNFTELFVFFKIL